MMDNEDSFTDALRSNGEPNLRENNKNIDILLYSSINLLLEGFVL